MKLKGLFAGGACAAALCAGVAFSQTPLLKGATGDVCDFVAEHAGKKIAPASSLIASAKAPEEYDAPFSAMLVETALADIDGDGDEELLHHMPELGRRIAGPIVLGAKDGLNWRGMDRGASETTRWGEASRWLRFGGQWHLIYFADSGLELADGVVTLDRKGADFACTFTRGFKEDVVPFTGNAAELAACEARKNGPFISAIKGGALTPQDIAYLRTPPLSFNQSPDGDIYTREIRIDAKSSVTEVDLDGDGRKERIGFMALDSGAGQGCGARFYELLPDAGKVAPDAAKAEKLRALQGVNWTGPSRFPVDCGTAIELFDIGGKAYLHSYSPGNSGNKREIKRLRGDLKVDPAPAGWPALPVCRMNFIPDHSVYWRASDSRPLQ